MTPDGAPAPAPRPGTLAGLEGDRAATATAAPALLRRIAVVAAVDAVLLVLLVAASVTDREAAVDVLGPLHGLGFLLELLLAVRGAGERLWGWWFPVAIAVTGGPLGALIGHRRITRRLRDGRPGPA